MCEKGTGTAGRDQLHSCKEELREWKLIEEIVWWKYNKEWLS